MPNIIVFIARKFLNHFQMYADLHEFKFEYF